MQKSSIQKRFCDSWMILLLTWIIFAIKGTFRYIRKSKCFIFGQFYQYFVLFSLFIFINKRYFAIDN